MKLLRTSTRMRDQTSMGKSPAFVCLSKLGKSSMGKSSAFVSLPKLGKSMS